MLYAFTYDSKFYLPKDRNQGLVVLKPLHFEVEQITDWDPLRISIQSPVDREIQTTQSQSYNSC